MEKELPVGESRDQLRGDDVTGCVLSFYRSKCELAGRLMLVAEMYQCALDVNFRN